MKKIATMARAGILGKPLFCLLAFLVLGGMIAALITYKLRASHEAERWVEHTYDVLHHIGQLNAALHEAESAQRGHVATGQAEFLASYQAVLARIEASKGHLDQLTADNTLQQDRLRTLDRLVADKRAFMDKNIAVVQEEPSMSLTRGQQLMASGEGLALMREIQQELTAFREHEMQLLRERQARAAELNRIEFLLLTGLGAALFSVMVAAFLAIRKELQRREAVEMRLREKSVFQQTLLNAADYAIIACAPNGMVTLFNPAAEAMLGYRAEEIVGRQSPALWHDAGEVEAHARTLSHVLGTDILPGFEVFTRVPSLEGGEEKEWTFVRKDGSRFMVLLSVVPLRSEEDRHITGFVGIAQDITQRKQIEQMKNEFISTVSHELRTPLTSIRGALGLVSANMGELPDHARQLIAIAHKNSERLVRLINNILDIEKIESGHLVFESRVLDAGALLAHAADEMGALARKSGLKLVTEGKADGVRLVGDEDRLLQVLGNFLSNAVKFSPPGGTVHLGVELHVPHLRFYVRDEGEGVPEPFRHRIFGKFAQADSSDARQKSGSGLGLSISKAIIESMGGEIGFMSRPGETVFYFTLPRHEAQESAPSTSPAPRRLLIVEDDEDIASLLRLSLEQEGFACDVAATAAEARARLAGPQAYLAMTLDLSLPDADGLSLIRELRQQERTLDLPIVVVSARAEQGRKTLNGDAVGILGWLPKPIDLERLKRLLASITPEAGTPHILYVEDEEDIVTVIATALEGLASVASAGSLAEARALLSAHAYDLAILDVQLPDGSGLDLLPELAQRPKPIPVIILSVTETPQQIQQKVMASLVKSVVPEDKIVETIKALISRRVP